MSTGHLYCFLMSCLMTAFTCSPTRGFLVYNWFLKDILPVCLLFMLEEWISFLLFCQRLRLPHRYIYLLIVFPLNLSWDRSSIPWIQINISLYFLVHLWSFNYLLHLEIKCHDLVVINPLLFPELRFVPPSDSCK